MVPCQPYQLDGPDTSEWSRHRQDGGATASWDTSEQAGNRIADLLSLSRYMAYIAELLWDEWSEDHIARHGVEPDEVEQLIANPYYVDRARDGLYRLIGQTFGGRYLTVILAPRGGDFYYS